MLEVGVDRGVMFIILTAFLARAKQAFTIVGIDVAVQEQVAIMANNFDLTKDQNVVLVQENSLTALPKLVEQNLKFDVVLIDGDHNYHTVSKELECLEAITHKHSAVIIDDYSGRWSEDDLWYADRPGYEANDRTTKKVDTEKHGVKAAVDEFVAAHPEWKLSQPFGGEPVLLLRED